jgi:U2 small nuclear ribonucleoprotein B''
MKQAHEAAEAQKNLKRPPPGPIEPAGKPVKTRGAGLKSTSGVVAVIPDEYLPPNKTLFVQNIPEDYSDVEALTALFSRFEGFREVRLVPTRKGIAFVEYEAEAGSISAKERMANLPLGETGQAIKVTFQRQ